MGNSTGASSLPRVNLSIDFAGDISQLFSEQWVIHEIGEKDEKTSEMKGKKAILNGSSIPTNKSNRQLKINGIKIRKETDLERYLKSKSL